MSDLIIKIDDIQHYQATMKELRTKHRKIGARETPETEIDDKAGMDYVKARYMRQIANDEYPGWSWHILKYEMVGSSWFIVHGRLMWLDEGIQRQGDMVAAHRIQVSRDDPKAVVDLSNDIKAANTDCLKKAFNLYMNISDDIYRWEVEESATDEQKSEIVGLMNKLGLTREAKFIPGKVMTVKEYEEKKARLEKRLEAQNE